MKKRMLSIILYFLIMIGSLLFVGVVFEQYARWRLADKVAKGNTFVDISGKPLHYVKKGQGDCTVVFQSGMGSSHAIWKDIQDSIAQNAVTISYDRNGLMWSDDAGMPVTNDYISQELHELLEKTNCPKPYIVVGHSMASVYLRPFIEKQKQDIAGIIFAEGANPYYGKEASPELLKTFQIPPEWLIKFVVNTGIYRTFFSFIPISKEIPLTHPLHEIERDFFYRTYNKVLEELSNEKINFQDAEKYSSFGDLPLTVITGTSDIRYAGIKDPNVIKEFKHFVNKGKEELLKLSSNNRSVNAGNSGHLLQINDPAIIVSEINRILQDK